MANLRVADSVRNAFCDALNTKLNAGAGGATIKIYSGTQPANANTALSGNTLLSTLTMPNPAFGASSSGTITANPIPDDTNAAATGTATFARVADSNGNTVFDCDVGTSGSTINLNSVAIAAGGIVRISSFTITMPNV